MKKLIILTFMLTILVGCTSENMNTPEITDNEIVKGVVTESAEIINNVIYTPVNTEENVEENVVVTYAVTESDDAILEVVNATNGIQLKHAGYNKEILNLWVHVDGSQDLEFLKLIAEEVFAKSGFPRRLVLWFIDYNNNIVLINTGCIREKVYYSSYYTEVDFPF